ncbi:hypothetical protein V501_09672 [Pseudogymnoascus sp. VKM F-4519 (FW-2642)]|nr:hypothetical protein V501_09672 [Pseudogymnoascus sp. VKM F-4519 (FW-2642)]
MSLVRRLLLGATYLALTGSSSATVLSQNQACIPNPTVITVEIIQVSVVCPVLLSAFILESTKITLAPGCTIVVSDAPTSLSTLVTITTLSESTITHSSSSPASTVSHSSSHRSSSSTGYPIIPSPSPTTSGVQHQYNTTSSHPEISPPYPTTSEDHHHHYSKSTRYVTTTTFLPPNGTAFTSTKPGNWRRPGTVVVGYVESLVTKTISGSVATTYTVPPSGTVPGTVVVESQPWQTATTYLDNGESAYTSTAGFNVTVGVSVGTVTTTTFLNPTATGFTTAIPAVGPTSGTVLIGYVQSVVTETITGATAATTTIAPSGTVTGTVIITIPTPDVSCNNQGIQWAVFDSFLPNDGIGFSAFNPTVFKTETPLYNSVTSSIGGFNIGGNSAFSIYGSTQRFGPSYFALNHRGYLFAPSTGVYTFLVTNPDDIAIIWGGADAYEGYTRANSDSIATYPLTDDQQRSYEVELVAGEYYPIRVIFGQGVGPAIFYTSVTAPDGTVLLDSDSGYSPYLVQFSCDGIAAPAYPAWGHES